MQQPHKSPGAGTDINDHRVTFQKAGWFTFGYCTCGWIDCDSDQGMLTIKAAIHGIIPGRPV